MRLFMIYIRSADVADSKEVTNMKKFKSMLLIVFALVLCFYAMPQPAIAASGSFGKNLRWNFDSAGTLTISGKGAIPDYEDASKTPWFSVFQEVKKIVIKNGVTEIGDRAFYGCQYAQNVSIPDGVKRIGEEAFYGVGMQKLKIPDSVTSIGKSAFKYCSNLTTVTLSNRITTINRFAFGHCSKLKTITIPSSVKVIGDSAFYLCESLESITIPRNVERIEQAAFGGCSSLKKLYIYSKTFTFFTYNTPDFPIYGNTPIKTIYGYKGSAAESLAKEAGVKFVDIETVHTHTWSEATCKSPKKCELCGKTSGSKADHSYSNACDATCNRCNAKRSVKHSYTNACDATCDKCNAVRNVKHTYSDTCDATCDKCNATRAVRHTFRHSCDISCSQCHAARGATESYRILVTKATSHMYKAVKTESGTQIQCVICQKTVSKRAA